MSADTFWNNREQAQKLIDEATSLRKRTEPLAAAEKHLDDLRTMLELSEAEPVSRQEAHQLELDRDISKFRRELDAEIDRLREFLRAR